MGPPRIGDSVVSRCTTPRVNHSFTFLRLACCTHAHPPRRSDRLSVSAHALPRGANPARCRTSLAKSPLKENGHPRAEVGTYRDIGNVQSTVPYPAWRHRSTHSPQMFSRIIAKWLPPSARHYTTGCSLSPHATSHTMIVPSEAAGRFRGGRARCSSRLPRRPRRGCSLGRMPHYTTGCSQSYHRLLSSSNMCPQRHKALWL